MSDSEKIATLLSQVRQKDEALRGIVAASERLITENNSSAWAQMNDAREKARAALSPTPQPDAAPADMGRVPERECFWLIERKVTPPQYTDTDSSLPGLTNDPWRAFRYNTERQAHEAWRRLVTLRNECKVVEHMFINKTEPASPLPADDVIEQMQRIDRIRHSLKKGRYWAAPEIKNESFDNALLDLEVIAANLLRQSALVENRKLTSSDQDEIAVIIHDHRIGVASDNIARMVVEHINKKLGVK